MSVEIGAFGVAGLKLDLRWKRTVTAAGADVWAGVVAVLGCAAE